MNLEIAVPAVEEVQAYYNERVDGKLRDFTEFNPRIEAAICTLAEWAPAPPRRVLEIGCGVGATAWRMARAWPGAEVVGADISPGSIDVANACFRRPNLRYRAGVIDAAALDGEFDLVLMMDVYEHVGLRDRVALHAAIRKLLAEECRVILTVPTPALQHASRETAPGDMQPVDEDIGLPEVMALAEATATEVLLYRQVGIWSYGDYAHIVLGRQRPLADVALRQPRPSLGLRHAVATWLRGFDPPGRRDHLGDDFLRPEPRAAAAAFAVDASERRRIVADWLQRTAAVDRGVSRRT